MIITTLFWYLQFTKYPELCTNLVNFITKPMLQMRKLNLSEARYVA